MQRTVIMNKESKILWPNDKGRFGEFGGRYVPETLIPALDELLESYEKIKSDKSFIKEFSTLLEHFVGRPTPLYFAENLTKYFNGPKIYLKREELSHTGAHKINNAIGQALLAKKMGKTRIIAETGAGQHGVATATVCAKLGLECHVYMGSIDIERQNPNVRRMELLGTNIIPVNSGTKTLKDAINEAIRDWVSNVDTTHYLIGSAIGPHPYPVIVRDFQSVIGAEVREQSLKQLGTLPNAVIACVGGGSNAIGMGISVFSTDVQNVYVDGNKLLVASSSIPSYGTQPLDAYDHSVTFSGTFSGTNWEISSQDHAFYTGDSIYYSPNKITQNFINSAGQPTSRIVDGPGPVSYTHLTLPTKA